MPPLEPRRSRHLQNLPPENLLPPLPPPPPPTLTPQRNIEEARLHDTRELVGAMQFVLSNRRTILNDKNYGRWKKEMELRLKGMGLWNLIINPRPEVVEDDIAVKESQLLMNLLDSCESDQRELIIDSGNPQQAWNTLRLNYENQAPTNPTILWREFEQCQQMPTESMSEYISRVRRAIRVLRPSGETVSTYRVLERLIMGLDRKYDILKSNLNIR